MKKSLFGVAAVGLAVGVLAWSTYAKPDRPRNVNPEARELMRTPAGVNAWSFTAPAAESSGFEASEGWNHGFLCDPATFTNCLGPPLPAGCTGDPAADGNCCIDDPNPNTGWYMSVSSEHCGAPWIDTENPANGEQHVRFATDGQGNPLGCVGFGGGCRVSMFTPTAGDLSGAIGPFTISYNVAQVAPSGVPPWGSSFLWFSVADAGTQAPEYHYFSYYGVAYVYDNGYGSYWPLGYTSGSGAYDTIVAHHDPCNGTITYDWGPIDAVVEGVHMQSAGYSGLDFWMERAIFLHDNNVLFWDIDDYSIVRDDICVTTCGADGIEAGEECDHGKGEDALCPGRCIAPGEEDECQCMRPCTCDEPCEVTNGANGPFLTSGGFFKYTADTPFTSIDVCGSQFDTELYWDFDCAEGLFNDTNDDCDRDLACAGSTESCLCVETIPGTEYIFAVGAWDDIVPPPLGTNVVINIFKKIDCDTIIPDGACCNTIDGTCAETPVEQCSCIENEIEQCVWYENKTCDLISCDRYTGACCDGVTGMCVDGLFPEDCLAEWQVYTKGASCIDVVCEEITGACCNTLNGTCYDVIAGDCILDEWTTWTKGAPCSSMQCAADMGSCCDHDDGSCTMTTNAGCNCEKCAWDKGGDCATMDCMANFTPIPTVSEWGLAILALLLLVGAKIYFGRRQTATA